MYSQVLHSIWLQSLGNAIIHSLWQSLILLIFYKLFLLTFRKMKPAGKHNLSVLLVIASFVWFVFTFFEILLTNDTPTIIEEGLAIERIHSIIPALSANTSVILSLAYLTMLVFMVTRLIMNVRQASDWKHATLFKPGQRWIEFTNHSAALLKISRKVSIWVSESIRTPFTTGFLKPVILLPVTCLTHLTPTQIEAIIVHELSHIKRNDYLINLLLSVIETVLFFNPAVFILMQNIRNERENCCDDLVLEHNYEPENYARALLELSKNEVRVESFALSAVSKKNLLLSRIKRITGNEASESKDFYRRILVYFVIIGLLFGASPFLPSLEKRLFAQRNVTLTPGVITLAGNNIQDIVNRPEPKTEVISSGEKQQQSVKKEKTVTVKVKILKSKTLEQPEVIPIIPEESKAEINKPETQHKFEIVSGKPVDEKMKKAWEMIGEFEKKYRKKWKGDKEYDHGGERMIKGYFMPRTGEGFAGNFNGRTKMDKVKIDSMVKAGMEMMLSIDSLRVIANNTVKGFSLGNRNSKSHSRQSFNYEPTERYRYFYPQSRKGEYRRPLRKADI
ncbi:MAG: M48 family metalloprotease [Chitinophagaceae bacterium]|nr:M48 family metalloprotease [Chitinophagaceae bacterium]